MRRVSNGLYMLPYNILKAQQDPNAQRDTRVPERKVKHTNNPTKPTILMTADVQSASQEPQYAFLEEARKE